MRRTNQWVAAALAVGMAGVLLWIFAPPRRLEGLPRASLEERSLPAVDFDGDRQVSTWEEINVKLWAEHERLSAVLDRALAEGRQLPLRSGGHLKVSRLASRSLVPAGGLDTSRVGRL